MKVWIDFLTPKHLLLLTKLAERLRERGFEVLLTTRAHREVLGLMELKKVKALVIGKYGSTLKEKLIASIDRMRELVPIVSDFSPDLVISHSSPEAARVAFGLGIPHYSINDSPHAIHAAKLTLPLSEILFCSWIIPKEAWLKFGISPNRIVQYRGIDQIAWIRDFRPNINYVRSLGIPISGDVITIRESEVFASYLLGSVDSLAPVTDSLLPNLLKKFEDAFFVVLPRYDRQIEYLRNKYRSNRVLILDKVVDGTNLLYFSKVFIGGGGTMTGEAALLGTPTISAFPKGGLYIIDYLVDAGLVFRASSTQEMLGLIEKMLEDRGLLNGIKQKAESLRRSMEDPLDVILKYVYRQ